MLNYEAIVFPVYTVHTDNVEMADGILWVEDQVLDDRNMKGKTLSSKVYGSRYPVTANAQG